MKRYLIITLAIFFLTTSCNKILNQQPQGLYATSEFFKTEAQALLAINACYQPLSFANSGNRLWVVGDVASDDAVAGGFPGDQADIGLIDNFQIFPNNSNLASIWSIYYEGISRCNMVLKYVPSINMDKAMQERIMGEAYFLRGYYYFQLGNIFGNVPLILKPLLPANMQVPNSEQAVVYKQVETDFISAFKSMEGALKLNPNIYPPSEPGRATAGAAEALLAKTYLFEQKWADAASACDTVATFGYSLMPVYSEDFNVNYDNNKEEIFQVQQLSGQSPSQGNSLNQWLAPRARNGYGFDEPTQNFVNEFEMTKDSVYDPRLDYTLGRAGHLWFDGVPYNPSWSSTGYNQRKTIQPFSEIPESIRGDGSLNFTIIRYAEVLLIKAEALCEMGDVADAEVSLNQVRKRARDSYLYDTSLPGYGTIPKGLLPDITTTDPTILLAAIRHERRVELGFESMRYFDIIRYGKAYADKVFSDKPNFNYDINKVFPIPQSEIETNKNITQNFGY